MIKPDFVKRYEKILLKWRNYKRLRSAAHGNDCKKGHPDFLTWQQREQMFEDLLTIIEFSKDD